jgi:hypothetical protein
MTLEMNQPTGRLRSVRDGQLAPVTCVACGCRLESMSANGAGTWAHFGRLGGRDARGCRVPCVDADHDRTGRPILAG